MSPFTDDEFGISVAISEDTVAVGAWKDADNGTAAGSAYVFVKPGAGWSGALTETGKLMPGDGAANDYFGQAIAVGGSTVVVGAPWDNENGSASGSASVFCSQLPEIKAMPGLMLLLLGD